MCFHSAIKKEPKAIETHFGATFEHPEDYVPQDAINGFNYPETPVITNVKNDIIQQYHWGLIPSWSKDFSIRQYTLNARIETLDEKPSFRDCVQNRCLILADGFYEWQWLDKKGKSKQKYKIHLPNDKLYAYAGIYSEWKDSTTNEVFKSYSMITTEAQGIMREIHNSKMRMPIILPQDREQEWLQGEDYNAFKDVMVDLQAQKIEVGQLGLF